MVLFKNYKDTEESLNDRISNVAVYNQGSLNYDLLWTLSEAELSRIEKIISERIKMLSKAGIAF